VNVGARDRWVPASLKSQLEAEPNGGTGATAGTKVQMVAELVSAAHAVWRSRQNQRIEFLNSLEVLITLWALRRLPTLPIVSRR
jgi:hypothetical protein